MADTSTTHLNLIKQDPDSKPDIDKDHSNLDTLDDEVWARGKTFNGATVGEDGGFHVRSIPYAENLETSTSQSSDESYIIRTTGGEASLSDGDAWLTLIQGTYTHTGYVPQSISMEVSQMVREEGEEGISATIDDDVFVAYVPDSGTTTLTYSTAWSANPANYGITVTGTPIAGDVITVVYVKEVRGTIIQSNPQTFVSTGWNLYNNASGVKYARVLKYSENYNFKVSGTYTALEFSTTPTGSRTTISPVSGSFSIPSDGYVHVTGGNATDTAIWMTWSDWTNGYNWNPSTSQQGAFQAYSESVIDLSTFMGTYFPNGLLAVGTARDEINLNIGVATSRVSRVAYTAENLANAKASGRQYEYDQSYIYIERSTPVTYSVSVEGDYIAYDHGMEFFTGTDQAVYAQTLYGANLKNKLERDVLTISQQTLTSAEKTQVQSNIGIPTLWATKNENIAYQFNNTSLLTSQVDAMPNYSYRVGIINSYGYQTATGVPMNSSFYVEARKFSASFARITIYHTANPEYTYDRFKTDGTWKDWRITSRSAYRKGQTINLSFDGVVAFLTAGQTHLFITVPMNMEGNITGFDLTSLKIGLRRSGGGYIEKDQWEVSGYTFATTVVDAWQNQILFEVVDNNKWYDNSTSTPALIPNNTVAVGRVTLAGTFT